jgi:hypothetical protein
LILIILLLAGGIIYATFASNPMSFDDLIDLRFLPSRRRHRDRSTSSSSRELQAKVIRQIQEETDPLKRQPREEAALDIDDIFEPVCPRCREPIQEAGASGVIPIFRSSNCHAGRNDCQRT